MTTPAKYRLFIDEVGNPSVHVAADRSHRHLSLTGIIVGSDYDARCFTPEIEALKSRYFGLVDGKPVVLHRKELFNKGRPFHALRDPAIEARFYEELLHLLESLEYTTITVVIDKLRHKVLYQTWRYHPYHYCLEVMLERYVLWLRRNRGVGDVMAEARGAKEDRQLEIEFRRIHYTGTPYVKSQQFEEFLTSREIKMQPKTANIIGLQWADLVAGPSHSAAIRRRDGEQLTASTSDQIAGILETRKFDRDQLGNVEGWGLKWLP